MIRIAEDLFARSAVDGIRELGAFAQSKTKQVMGKIGFGFLDAGDGISLRGGTRTQSFDLRKDEPHPVRCLLARAQFVADLPIDPVLGVEESLQIVGVGGHCGELSNFRPKGEY